jgi:DHA2 family metal-tetracycline-proton antiporter-like MFS transporter
MAFIMTSGAQTVVTDQLLTKADADPQLYNLFRWNGTMFNVSIPTSAASSICRRRSLGVSYIILFALGTVTYGKLADSRPVKNLITFGLILFSFGSFVGFLARWYPMLIAGRMLQACGAGAIPALAMLVATRYFPAEIRGRSLGIIASTIAFGGAVGPILGGFITGSFHWRYLFLFSMFAPAAIPLLRRILPDEHSVQPGSTLGGVCLFRRSHCCVRYHRLMACSQPG